MCRPKSRYVNSLLRVIKNVENHFQVIKCLQANREAPDSLKEYNCHEGKHQPPVHKQGTSHIGYTNLADLAQYCKWLTHSYYQQ